MASEHGRMLSRSYSLAATASLVPLFIIVLVLALYQFTAQRDQVLRELEEDATRHNVLLTSVIKSVREYVRSLGTWAELYLEQEETLPAALADPAARGVPGMRLVQRDDGIFAPRQHELALAARLVDHMRLSHGAMPYVRWSYYLSAKRDFAGLFPVYDEPGPGGGARPLRKGDTFDLVFASDVFEQAASDGPARQGYWTEAYPDPGGAGWVVGHARPVHRGDDLLGVVGTAVLLDFLTGFLRAFDYPCGELWLVDDERVLAASDGRPVTGTGLPSLAEMLPAGLEDASASELLRPSAGFRRIDGTYVLAQPVGASPWSLLLVVTPEELNGVLLPRLLPYGIILGGLIVTLLLAQQVRQRLVIGPALAFVEFIGAESRDLRPPRPKLPAVWQPWLDTVAEAFAAKRSSLARVRDSAEHFRTIAESHPVPIVIVGLEDGRILHCSQAFAEQYRIPLDEAKGKDCREFYVDLADREHLLRELRAHGFARVEFQARRADGSTFPGLMTSRLIAFEGSQAVVTGVLDLSEQKRAEAEIARQREALRQSEQRFRMIAEAHPVPMYILRRSDRCILYASQRFADLVGLSLDEVYRSPVSRFFPNADERLEITLALRRDHAVSDLEVTACRADGTMFPAALTARLIVYEGEEAGVFGVVDLTEKKRIEAEIERQREALHQSEKLNALGSLLASVAHELNNPLSVVVGYSTMMRDLAPDAATKDRAARIHGAAERCARIVKTFLAMARQKPEHRQRLQLNRLIEAALEVAGYGLRTADIGVDLDLDPDLPEITGDADQLTLVLMNLIVNAQHALQTVAPPRRLEITTRRDGGRLRLVVTDNGPGIPANIRHRIFEPFFTTKPQGVGTGIGLSLCYNAITAHDGEISVDEGPAGGARFTVLLPCTGGEVCDEPAEEAMPRTVKGRILVVEDEVEIAEVLAEMLGRDGHEVQLAQSGREALERLEAERVDLIISDLHMPDLDGRELHRALTEKWPEGARRMVFITGDVLAADMTGFLSETGLPVFDKPIDPYDLRLKVRAQLAALGRAA